MFMRITIKLKLAAAFAVLTLLAATVAWLGIGSLGSFNTAVGDLIRGPATRVQLADELRFAAVNTGMAEKNILVSNSPEEILKNKAELQRRRGLLLQHFENIQNMATGVVSQKLDALTPMLERWTSLLDRVADLMQRGSQAEAKALAMQESRDVRLEIVQRVEEIRQIENQFMKQAKEGLYSEYNQAWQLLAGVAAAALLISVISGVILSLSINRGLRRAVSLADAVARGDLNRNVTTTSNDEIKDLIDSLNRMTANLRVTAEMADAVAHGDLSVDPKPLSEKDTLGLALQEMTRKLRTVVSDALSAAGSVSSGSEELSSACQQLSAGANEQARG